LLIVAVQPLNARRRGVNKDLNGRPVARKSPESNPVALFIVSCIIFSMKQDIRFLAIEKAQPAPRSPLPYVA
jgi:hypothetical protein